jgi:hypothetical protein
MEFINGLENDMHFSRFARRWGRWRPPFTDSPASSR